MKTRYYAKILLTTLTLLFSKQTWSQVPLNWELKSNYFQNNGVVWKNEITRAQNISLQKAFDIVKYNTSITYFYFVKSPSLIEVKMNSGTQKILFNTGDAIFFSGEPTMSSSSMADCYFKKDTKSEEKNSAIMEKQEKSSNLLSFDNIQFERGTTKIINSSESIINEVTTYMMKNPAVQIQISGHTDNTGNENLNIKLSQDRADEIKRLLVLKNVASTRITTRGYGSSQPLTNNSTEELKAKNRRIEFRVPKNMIINGGFENPKIDAGTWSYFNSVQGWTIRGKNKFEIQNQVAGEPIEGKQFVELDGIKNSQIIQEIKTVAGEEYVLSFCFTPRPGTSIEDNKMEVYWNNKLIKRIEKQGSDKCNWETYQYAVKCDKNISILEFKDVGKSNGLGNYIDNICLFPVLLLEKK